MAVRSAVEHKYIVDITGKLPTILLEIDKSTSSLEKTYIYADRQILAQHDGDSSDDKYFYLHDRLGSVRLVLADNGDVVKYYTYEPFGEVIDDDGTFDNAFRFTGQYFDAEIEEYYLRARQYNPQIARFTSRDPVFGKPQLPATMHRYLYCLNNPINSTDPSGRWAVVQGLRGDSEFTTATASVGFLTHTVSGPLAFYGVEDGTYNVFFGEITFVSVGVTTPSTSVYVGFSFGFSEDAQCAEDLRGRYDETGGSLSLSPYAPLFGAWPFGHGVVMGGTHAEGRTASLDMVTIGIGGGPGLLPGEVHISVGYAFVENVVAF